MERLRQKEKKVAEEEMLRITNSIDMNLSKLLGIVRDREAWHAVIHAVTNTQTQLSN